MRPPTPCPLLARPWWLPLALAACTTVSLDDGTAGSGSSSSSTTTEASSGPGITSTSGASITTGADTSGSSGSGSGSSDTGLPFIHPPDVICSGLALGGGWSTRCFGECDTVAQDCIEGDKCMPWANDGGDTWNASRCSPIAPDPVPPGGPCTAEDTAVSGADDCALGSMCWSVDPKTLQGTCAAFCDPLRIPSETCAAPTLCVPLNEGYMPLCLTPCNPLQAAACPDGEACRHVDGDGGFYCLPLDGGVVMGSSQHCDDATCSPSQLCLPAGVLEGCATERCCTELCDTGDPGADALCAALGPTLACEPFYEPGAAPAGLEPVGACIVPM
jgi:hypothetical protein